MSLTPQRFCLFFLFLGLISWTALVSAMPNFGPVAMTEFYTSLPKLNPQEKLGHLIKAEKIATTLPGTQAWKIAYISSDVNEHKTLVTAILAAPSGAAPTSGRPVIAWAHGTTGTAENCGPSQILNPAQPLNQYFLMTGDSWTDYGLPAMAAFIKAGYVIVATDYQGLGGGGKHQYSVAATQARDLINAIRAARQVKEAGAGSQALIYGWSQGGGATLAAASLDNYLHTSSTASDPIQLLGFIALAPFDVAVTLPAKIKDDADATKFIQALAKTYSTTIFNFTHFAQNIWGMVAAFPELKLEDIFTAEGVAAINAIMERKCMHAAADTLNFNYGANYKSLLRPDIKNALAWINAYRKSSVTPVKPIAPVIIYWGNKDVTVPPIMGQLYQKQMCQLNGHVSRIKLPGNQNHFTTPASAEPLYVAWIADRLSGKPTSEDDCKTESQAQLSKPT